MSIESKLNNRAPVYRKLQAEMRKRIKRGDWMKGDFIPSRRALADEFQVSVPTVQKAITDMVTEGLLLVDAKRGTYVFGEPDLEIDPLVASNTKFSSISPRVRPSNSQSVVGLVADVRPNSGGELSNTRSFVLIRELEEQLAKLEIKSRFYNLFPSSRIGSLGEKLAVGGDKKRSISDLVSAISGDRCSIVVVHDGIIRHLGPDIIERLNAQRVPVIVMGDQGYGLECVNVMQDNVNAAYQATRHLIKQGCTRIQFLSPFTEEWVSERCCGVKLAIKSSRLPQVKDEYYIGLKTVHQDNNEATSNHPHDEFAFAQAKELLANGFIPNGVIAANDEIAVAFARAAEVCGLAAGRDYAIIGFDDNTNSHIIGLSSMHPPLAAMGRETAKLVARHLQSDDDILSVVLKSRLIVRSSSERLTIESLIQIPKEIECL